MGRIYGSGRRHSAHDRKQTDLSVKKRNHIEDLRYSERTAWISRYAVCRKSTDGNESRAYLCMHEFEKTGKDPGKTRLEYSQIFVDFEKNKKKRSFKRKMVLGITPNTKFVYSLKWSCVSKQLQFCININYSSLSASSSATIIALGWN